MGRNKEPIWKNFVIVRVKKPHPDVMCKYCEHPINNAQVGRHLVPHVITCPNTPAQTKAMYKPTPHKSASYHPSTPSSGSVRKRKARLSFSCADQPDGTPLTPQTPKTRRATREQEDREITMDLAMAFYATGVSFRVLEDPHMKRLFGRLRPGFVLPSRRRLAGPLLDSVYERERNKTIGMLKAKPFVALVTDGWADPNNQSIVNFVLCTPYNSPVFWASIATGDNRHTAEYMAQQIEKVITDIEATIGAGKVSSIVTDNASNMKAAWALLTENRPELFCNGCGAHMLNLLMKDVFKIAFFAAVLEKARFMAKYIRKRYVLLDRFRDKQKKVNSSKERRRGLCIPVATRWYSAEACIRSVVENKIFLQAVFEDKDLQKMFKTREQKSKLQKTTDLLSDASFWVDAGVVLQLIHPINEALAAFESDLTWVSAVYDEFNKLERNKVYVNEHDGSVNLRDIQREILELIVSRRKLLVSPSMRIGYLLDHRMSPKGFAENEQNTAIIEAVRIARLHGIGDENDVRAFQSEVTRFVRFKYEFSQTYNVGDVTLSPWEWWMFTNAYPRLRDFAMRIFSIPTSSAASERSWSIHDFIHSKRRNRLKPRRVEKLVFIYTNSKADSTTGRDHAFHDMHPDAPDADADADDERDSEDDSD